jgi:hypothetical protein
LRSGSVPKPVLRIHVILGWIRIRIRGSMPLTNGSGFGSGSWIRILQFSSLTFKMPAKNKFFNTIFSAYDFFKLDLRVPHFSTIKIQKDSQNSRNQGFSYYFCMIIEGSGSWRPKNTWIRWTVPRRADPCSQCCGSGSGIRDWVPF